MSKLKTLEDLFHHQLKDLYSAETQLISALPKMIDEASDKKLKDAFKSHLEETKRHQERLEEIADSLDINIKGETCKAMQGLIREAKSFISEDASATVRDAGIIADAQRIEHYEIAAYGATVEFAKTLGKDDIAKKLHETLDEEFSADDKLTKIAKDHVNKEAVGA